jgi:hypothetical protein
MPRRFASGAALPVGSRARSPTFATRSASLRLNKAYATAVVLTLALGIGANAAMFTLINAVGAAAAPVADPGQSSSSISLQGSREPTAASPTSNSYDEWGDRRQTVQGRPPRDRSSMIFRIRRTARGRGRWQGRCRHRRRTVGVLGREAGARPNRSGAGRGSSAAGPDVMVLSGRILASRLPRRLVSVVGKTVSAEREDVSRSSA